MRYKQQYEGDIVRPVMKGYKMMCCDCGLVHTLDFFVIRWGRGHKVKFRARRDARATSSARRGKRRVILFRYPEQYPNGFAKSK